MVYKCMLLSVLLIPATIIGNNADTRIEQLKKDVCAKELEITDLNKMIMEKEQLIDALMFQGREFYAETCSILDDQDQKEFKEAIKAFEELLSQSGGVQKAICHSFLKKDLNPIASHDEVERVKCWILRHNIEYRLLNSLLGRYKQCLQELLDLDAQLEKLQS